MNKKILLGAATALSMLGSTAAMAGPSDKVVYGNGPLTVVIPQQNGAGAGAVFLADLFRGSLPADLRGARYEQESTVAGNTVAETPIVTTNFNLTGSVTPDCSFYSGDSTVSGGVASQTINLGQIGVQTGNNVNNSLAFDQVGPINANVNTSTAGCNTNNKVTITKANGADGLVSDSTASFDPAQFTDNIPYSVVATWTGVAVGSSTTGTRTLTVGSGVGTAELDSGAWRSSFNMNVTAPAPALGLLAGTYTDTIEVVIETI